MERAHGPTGRHQFGRLEIRVRSPVGPLMEGSRIRLAGPLWKGGSPNGDEGSTPLPSARRPDGETDDHTSLRTRRSGFESWSGYFSPVVQRAGHSRDIEKIAGSNSAG